MNKTINIIYSEQQRNVFLEVESILVNLINHQGKESAQLNYISSEQIKSKGFQIPSGIILSNEDLIRELILNNNSVSKDICNVSLCSSKSQGDSNVLVFNMDQAMDSKIKYLKHCFNFLQSNGEHNLNVLVKNATHLNILEKEIGLSIFAKQYKTLKLNFVFADELDEIKSFRFETILSFLPQLDLEYTLFSKDYSMISKPVYINSNFIAYSIAQSENGLGNLESYFNDLSSLVFLLESIGLHKAAECLTKSIRKVKDEYRHEIENPLDIYRFGEMISYAIEDGDSYQIIRKGPVSQFGIII